MIRVALLCLVALPAQADAERWKTSYYVMGHTTANGEPYDPMGNTCAHKTLPFGTVLELSHGGAEATCRVNDRGPFVPGRDLDVSLGVAQRLGIVEMGVAYVSVRIRE
jgi:rare lipoprotein A